MSQSPLEQRIEDIVRRVVREEIERAFATRMREPASTAESPEAKAEYVDDRVLARRTPISRSQWQAWRQQGEGPPWRKVGRRCIYKWSDVASWLARHDQVTSSKAVPLKNGDL